MRISIPTQVKNINRLNAELDAALGLSQGAAQPYATGVNGQGAYIRVLDSAYEAQLAQFAASYDEGQLPPTPEDEARRQREQVLDQQRQANRQPLDLSAYSNAEALVRGLAERVAWLEAELRHERGGSSSPPANSL